MVLGMDEIFLLIENSSKEPVTVLPVLEWIERVIQADMNTLLAEYLQQTLGCSIILTRLLLHFYSD